MFPTENEYYRVDDGLGGWSVTRKCPVCNNSLVFVHNAKTRLRAETAVNNKFNEIHNDCLSSIPESSAVQEDPSLTQAGNNE